MSKINLKYENPKTFPLSSNMLLVKDGGGGKIEYAKLDPMVYIGVIGNPPGIEDGVWISRHNIDFRDKVLLYPTDENFNGINTWFKETKPFKIHARIYFVSLSRGSSSPTNTLCGSSYSPWRYPSLDMKEDYFWGGIGTGSTWRAGVTLTPLEGESSVVEYGKIYGLDYGWDGTKLYINLYNDKNELINHAEILDTIGHAPNTDGVFCFGGMAGQSMHITPYNYYDLTDTYVEIDNEIVWGQKKF